MHIQINTYIKRKFGNSNSNTRFHVNYSYNQTTRVFCVSKNHMVLSFVFGGCW